MAHAIRSLPAVLVVALLGCGGDDPATSTTTADAGADTDGSADGAAPPDAAPSDAGSGDSGPKTSNELILSTGAFANAAGTTTNLLFLNFAAAPTRRCATTLVGPCTVIDCSPKLGVEPDGVSAGAISLTVNGSKVLTATPGAANLYAAAFKSSELWKAGDDVTLAAAGAEVPAFSASFRPAARVELLSPDPAATTPPGVKRGSELTVTWKPQAGDVGVWISQTPSSAALNSSTRFLCTFDATKGTGTLPSAVTSVLSTSASLGSTTTNMNVGAVAEQRVTAGGYAVRAFAMNARTVVVTVE